MREFVERGIHPTGPSEARRAQQQDSEHSSRNQARTIKERFIASSRPITRHEPEHVTGDWAPPTGRAMERKEHKAMERRVLGKTGMDVSVLGFGGAETGLPAHLRTPSLTS